MARLNRFGQYVKITVTDDGGSTVFESDSLRIDFDVINTSGWIRAKITLFNILPETFKKITGNENGSYIKITTSLHGEKNVILVDNLFISNALEEKKLPNSVSTFYCYSKLRRTLLEKPISITVKRPSLRNIVKEMCDAAGFSGEIKYRFFTEGYIDYVPPKPVSKQEGSVLSCLQILGNKKFDFFLEDNSLVISSRVHFKHKDSTELITGDEVIKLSTDNMRSNPRLGVAALEIESNLDPNIKPSTILDISDILTAGAKVSSESFKVAEGLIKTAIAGTKRYQTLTVRHKGSNFDKNWSTTATAVAPTSGFNMPIVNWFR